MNSSKNLLRDSNLESNSVDTMFRIKYCPNHTDPSWDINTADDLVADMEIDPEE
ncbi:40931_t:CDS:2 [Gigaspora margarita]|uniref:40931_t:CDS:1 n=1 Tax=Gigaspora margarita TaxID=4874 RepID=A0ABM8W267_GIGMA|nr:40931_t:CDS:2 [Gigaspora margarita]